MSLYFAKMLAQLYELVIIYSRSWLCTNSLGLDSDVEMFCNPRSIIILKEAEIVEITRMLFKAAQAVYVCY